MNNHKAKIFIFVSNYQPMLQRVQTIWLFFATAAIFSLFLFPYLQVINPDGTSKAVKVTGVYESIGGNIVQTEPFLALTIVTVILGLIPFLAIFLFKNRKRQMMLCYICIAGILGFSFWMVQTAKQVLGNITLQTENYGLGVILPSLSVLFVILALRGIRSDEKLIKSAERLR
jgi:heme/copper-type cytochrome/quinol oxidase subunit 3